MMEYKIILQLSHLFKNKTCWDPKTTCQSCHDPGLRCHTFFLQTVWSFFGRPGKTFLPVPGRFVAYIQLLEHPHRFHRADSPCAICYCYLLLTVGYKILNRWWFLQFQIGLREVAVLDHPCLVGCFKSPDPHGRLDPNEASTAMCSCMETYDSNIPKIA